MANEFLLDDGDVDKYQFSLNCLSNAEAYINNILNGDIFNKLSKRKAKKLIKVTIEILSKGEFLKNDTISHIRNISGFYNFDIDITQKKVIER